MTWMRPRSLVRRTVTVIVAYALAAQAMVAALAVPVLDVDPAALCWPAGGAGEPEPGSAPPPDHSDCKACAIACGATPALARGEGASEIVAPVTGATAAQWPTAPPLRIFQHRAGLARAPPADI